MWSFATLYKIFYFLYILYLFTFAVGFEDFITVTSIIWIIVTLSIFLMIYALILLASGAQSVHLVNLHPGLVVVASGTILLLIGGTIYYLQKLTQNNIQTKIQNTNRVRLRYQYGRTSEELSQRIRTDEIFVEGVSLETYYKDHLKNSKLHLQNVFGRSFNEPEYVRMDLLWYLLIAEDQIETHLTREERNYILNCPTERLLEFLGPHYNGSRDRASLLFAILAGNIIETPQEPIERFEIVKNYRANIIWNLVRYQHRLIDHVTGTYSIQGPVLLLAKETPSYMETLLNNVGNEDLNNLVGRMGLVGKNNLIKNPEYNLEMIQDDLSLYYNVFTRPDNLGLPPNLSTQQALIVEEILSYYTNEELITAYEPRKRWSSRKELIETIKDDLLGRPQWSIQAVNYCNNDDTMNILTTELHRDINKFDGEDPTLSYGIHKNYRCYQMSELMASFREYEGTFSFRIPDWTENARDPIENGFLPQEFSMDNIKNLSKVIDESDQISLKPLGETIRKGMKSLGELSIKLKSLKNQYCNFTQEQKNIVNLYLSWLFTYAMWMRFWKGPGYPWPLKKISIHNPLSRTTWSRASPEERDEHIFIQHTLRTRIMESYETDPILKRFIDELPVIYYEFDTGESRLASHPVKETIDKIVIGKHCMGFGSDTILKTAYYYILNLLDQNNLDSYIAIMLPNLFELELNVVQRQITEVQPNTIRYDVLQNRLNELRGPIPVQPKFVAEDYQNNSHTNNI